MQLSAGDIISVATTIFGIGGFAAWVKVSINNLAEQIKRQNGSIKMAKEDIDKLKDYNLHHIEDCHKK